MYVYNCNDIYVSQLPRRTEDVRLHLIMEKFAVDLDKVLDEFEFNEDREEQMVAVIRSGCSNPSGEREIGIVPHQSEDGQYCVPTFEVMNIANSEFTASSQNAANNFNNELITSSSSLSFKKEVNLSEGSTCIDDIQEKNNMEHPQDANLYWQHDYSCQNVTVEKTSSNNKLNVSGVFSSLNEYLNAGTIEVSVGNINVNKQDCPDWLDNKLAQRFEDISGESSNSRNTNIQLRNSIAPTINDNFECDCMKSSVTSSEGNVQILEQSQLHFNNMSISEIDTGRFEEPKNMYSVMERDLKQIVTTVSIPDVDETCRANPIETRNQSAYLQNNNKDNLINDHCPVKDVNADTCIIPTEGAAVVTTMDIESNSHKGQDISDLSRHLVGNETNSCLIDSFNSISTNSENLKGLVPTLTNFENVNFHDTDKLFFESHSDIGQVDSVSFITIDNANGNNSGYEIMPEVKSGQNIPKVNEIISSPVNISDANETQLQTVTYVSNKILFPQVSNDIESVQSEHVLVGFNNLKEFSKLELHAYLQELEEKESMEILQGNITILGSSINKCVQENQGTNDVSKTDICSSVVNGTLHAKSESKFEDMCQPKVVENKHNETVGYNVLTLNETHCDISDPNSDIENSILNLQFTQMTNNKNSVECSNKLEIEQTLVSKASIVSTETAKTPLHSVQTNSSAPTSLVATNGNIETSINVPSNSHIMATSEVYTSYTEQNTSIDMHEVLHIKGDELVSVTSNSLPQPLPNTNDSTRHVDDEINPPLDNDSTISINMLSTGKATSNVTNVISIECQQTKHLTEILNSQNVGILLEGTDGSDSTTRTGGIRQMAVTNGMVMDTKKLKPHINEINTAIPKMEDGIPTTRALLPETSCALLHDKNEMSYPELPLNNNSSDEINMTNRFPENTVYHENLCSSSSLEKSTEMGRYLVQAPKDGSRINVLGEEERPSRPKFLFLPSKITMENQQDTLQNGDDLPQGSNLGPPGETPSAHFQPLQENEVSTLATTSLDITDNETLTSPDISENSSIEVAISPVPSIQTSSPSNNETSYMLSPQERNIGKLPPIWVPDADAPNCMLCDFKFTVLKRRHHCRACGKVFCSKCCSLKFRLEYMENSEARVCQPCFSTLSKVLITEQGESASESPGSLNFDTSSNASNTPLGRQPNPNNPMEYCSTIPPLEQVANALHQPVPSVLVPVGVLKREGSTRSKSEVAKQVMFSDGIRPGGDLTELDGSSDSRLPYRRQERMLKRVGTPPGTPANTSSYGALRSVLSLETKTKSYIPNKGLPPLASIIKGEIKLEEETNNEKLMLSLKSETLPPTMFALNRNLLVQVKILNLDCCVNRICWCFSTMGMSSVGQDEIVIILECLPDENTVPKDIFHHLNSIYQEASRGSMVSEMGHTIFQGTSFLGSSEHGGLIYIRPSFQCLHKLILPSAPYLVAILIHRWEIPWAKVFPIRLVLRLGAEFRYYPCMLVSIRQRKPVYCEIGHTIINLLADFRNLSYTLPSVRGMVIHMEDRHTSILLPKNRYDQVTRALNNSNDHVLALAANFSFSADSHLVCIQSHGDESYHTQAINIHNKPRKVTGASFVVFNGALKMSSNLTAKSSIVEDGLMVQITPDTIQELRAALRKMKDFSVSCGPAGVDLPDELVNIKWVQDDKNFNIGVNSFIDGRSLDGIPSIRVHNGTDYMGTLRFIRWTEVFILQSGENSERNGDPLDISRLSESLARATCLALVNFLDLLTQAGLTKLAVRANIHPEHVGYEAGSQGEKLPPIYMNNLDNELVPVLHKAASMSQESPPVILELIFHVMLQ